MAIVTKSTSRPGRLEHSHTGQRLLRTGVAVLRYLVLGGLSILMIFPFVWLLRSSVMSTIEIFTTPIQWLPQHWLWSNYSTAFSQVPFATYYGNTAILEILNITGTVLSSSFVAFGFARIVFWGRGILFAILLSALMLPTVATLIPTFVIWRNLGAINTYYPLFVPAFFGNPFFIFMMRQFYTGIPLEYDEAAFIDGASYLRIYWSIILPLSKPALVTVALFTFLSVWNDFLGPLIYLNDTNKYTVALGLQAYIGQFQTDWNLLMAASAVAILPVIVVFFVGQKSFIQGATLSGIKG